MGLEGRWLPRHRGRQGIGLMDREAQRIDDLLAPSLEAMGFELVRASLRAGPPGTFRRRRRDAGEPPGRVLQIMAERLDRQPLSGAECTRISRAVAAILDVEDPIAGPYVLEVSSPGIDRPLVKPDHFRRFEGREAKIELRRPVNGRKRLRGVLAGVDSEAVKLIIDGSGYSVPIPDIRWAKLVLTDELLRLGRLAVAAGIDDNRVDPAAPPADE